MWTLAATTAPWFRFRPGFESQANHLRNLQFILMYLFVVAMRRGRKRGRDWPIKKHGTVTTTPSPERVSALAQGVRSLINKGCHCLLDKKYCHYSFILSVSCHFLCWAISRERQTNILTKKIQQCDPPLFILSSSVIKQAMGMGRKRINVRNISKFNPTVVCRYK